MLVFRIIVFPRYALHSKEGEDPVEYNVILTTVLTIRSDLIYIIVSSLPLL